MSSFGTLYSYPGNPRAAKVGAKQHCTLQAVESR
jgi:hypothetical protein